jgi:uncharacterized protein (TIGR02145 family)
MKKLIKISVLIASMVIIFSSCKKDDNSPISPYNGKTTAVFNSSVTYDTLTDQDGNIYKTVTIGTQTWMAENLRTTKYRNGSAIHNVTDNTAWTNLTTGAYCNYNNAKDTIIIATYGRLYNWYAAIDIRNIAPTGWHVPSDAEWTTLITYLGGESIAGGKMKEIGTTHWSSPDGVADNSSGFTGLPSGDRSYFYDGRFGSAHQYGTFWSSTAYLASSAYYRYLDYYGVDCYRGYQGKEVGYSLRLIKN